MEDFKVESMEELQYMVLNKPIEYVMLIPDYLRCTKKNIMELNKSIIKNHKKQLIEVNKEYFKRAILVNKNVVLEIVKVNKICKKMGGELTSKQVIANIVCRVDAYTKF